MITIGRLADYAGVTIKAVRHFHRLGLLAEPPPDSSGYRNYSATDALTLVKIRTLAEAGSEWVMDVDPWAVVVRHGRWYCCAGPTPRMPAGGSSLDRVGYVG